MTCYRAKISYHFLFRFEITKTGLDYFKLFYHFLTSNNIIQKLAKLTKWKITVKSTMLKMAFTQFNYYYRYERHMKWGQLGRGLISNIISQWIRFYRNRLQVNCSLGKKIKFKPTRAISVYMQMYFEDLNIYDFSQDFITTGKKVGKKLNPSQTLTDGLMALPSTGIRR